MCRIEIAKLDRLERLDPKPRLQLKDIDSLVNKAEAQEKSGKHAAAVELWEQAVQLHKQILGEDHPGTPSTAQDALGMAVLRSGSPASAVPMIGAAMELSQKLIGEQLRDPAPNRTPHELAVAGRAGSMSTRTR